MWFAWDVGKTGKAGLPPSALNEWGINIEALESCLEFAALELPLQLDYDPYLSSLTKWLSLVSWIPSLPRGQQRSPVSPRKAAKVQHWLTHSDLQGPLWDSLDNPVNPPLAKSLWLQKLQLWAALQKRQQQRCKNDFLAHYGCDRDPAQMLHPSVELEQTKGQRWWVFPTAQLSQWCGIPLTSLKAI